MYTLYIANRNYSSWSLRPWVLMKTLGIPFKEILVPFTAGSSQAAFRAFSPTGLVPCLHDGTAVVWDSLAIVEYLAEHHPGVWPADGAARAFARSAAAEIHAGFGALRSTCSMTCGLRIRLTGITPELRENLDRLAGLWSEGLGRYGGPFLAGASFTAVDAFYAPVAFRFQTYGLEAGASAAEYVQRLLALPAMREWYAAALLETWREPGHEAEARAAGTVLKDYRAGA